MQYCLANLDRRVAPDDIEQNVLGHFFGWMDDDIVQPEGPGISGGEISCTAIDVDSHDRTLGTTQCHRQGDWSRAAPQVQELTPCGEVRSLEQEDLGSRVEFSPPEHSGIGLQVEGEIREGDVNGSRIGRRHGNGVGVVRMGARGSGHDIGSLSRMSYEIRTFGDPVLVTRAAEVTDINGKIVRMIDEMFDTLYDSDSGIGLAAPQVGIQRQIFVWDMEDDPQVIINPKIVESEGEWVYDEGCLSIPGLFVEMTRPKKVLMRGLDLDGNEIDIEADELEARLFQHELDHLNGVLMFDRMQPDQRSRAMAEYKKIKEQGFAIGAPVRLEAE